MPGIETRFLVSPHLSLLYYYYYYYYNYNNYYYYCCCYYYYYYNYYYYCGHCTCKHNIEAPLPRYYCRLKAVNITYAQCVSVALIVQR